MLSLLKKRRGPPNAESVTNRVIILKHIFVKSLATPPAEQLIERMREWSLDERAKFLETARSQSAIQIRDLREKDVWKAMSRIERTFMEADPLEITQPALLNATWAAEAAVCLLWAFGQVSELPPYDQRSNPELLNRDFDERAALRPMEELKKQRELAELWHWRSRTHQLQQSGQTPKVPAGGLSIEQVIELASAKAAKDGAISAPIARDFPAFNKAYRDLSAEEFLLATSIALERYRAFNWLCGYAPGNRWNATPTGA